MNRLNNTHYKSTTQFYNTTEQNILATNLVSSPLMLNLGVEVTDTGCALDFKQNYIDVESKGTYDINAELIVEGTTAGDITIALTDNGVILPETIRTVAVTTTSKDEIVTSTVRILNVCCANESKIGLVAYSDGTAVANITLVSGSVVKLA